MKPDRATAIGCDLDGVIGDIVEQLLIFSHREHGIKLTIDDIVSENIETCTPIRREQLLKFFETEEFFRTLPVISGARNALVSIQSSKCEIHIITDRFWYHGIQKDTTDWLVKNKIPFNSVTFARKAEKQHIATELKVKWFIEDQLSNALLLAPICSVLLIDRPYNQGATPDQVLRVPDIQEVAQRIARSNKPSRSLTYSQKPGESSEPLGKGLADGFRNVLR
jgi:uncharacterized HAD superfamily protein